MVGSIVNNVERINTQKKEHNHHSSVIIVLILTFMNPDPNGGDSLHVSGCTTQLGFDAAISIVTNRRIPISEGLQAASGKAKF